MKKSEPDEDSIEAAGAEIIAPEEEEESRLKKFLKRSYILIVCFFLAFLFLVNTDAGYHVISVLNGKIVSTSLADDYTLNLNSGIKVIFSKVAFERLSQVYYANQKHEFKACLTGEKKNSSYYIYGLYIPEIYAQDVFSVTAQLCNSSTIISLHSHPPLRCIFSEQDMKSYQLLRINNPEGMLGLMCGEKRFSFYGSRT